MFQSLCWQHCWICMSAKGMGQDGCWYSSSHTCLNPRPYICQSPVIIWDECGLVLRGVAEFAQKCGMFNCFYNCQAICATTKKFQPATCLDWVAAHREVTGSQVRTADAYSESADFWSWWCAGLLTHMAFWCKAMPEPHQRQRLLVKQQKLSRRW